MNDIRGFVGLAQARVAIGLRQAELTALARIARRIEDAEAALAIQAGGHLSAEPPLGQAQIQDREIRLVTLAEFHRRLDGTRDAAHLIPILDENVLEHIGHEEVVFGDQDLEHWLSLGVR